MALIDNHTFVPYRHTQTGLFLRWITAPPALGLFVAGYVAGKGLLFLPLALVLGAVSGVFSSLTVEVSEDQLVWYFGPGIWRKSVARREIETVTPVRNKWWWGWGIHLTPRGWLYNVSGMDAVQIALLNGTTIRIGSDEVAELARVLSRA